MADKKKKSPNSDQRMTGRGKMATRDRRNVQVVDCIARGPHDAKCICKGTGKIETKPLWLSTSTR